MDSGTDKQHILIDLTCPNCERKNSVAIQSRGSEERADIRCPYCQNWWEQVLPGPFVAGPFPK